MPQKKGKKTNKKTHRKKHLTQKQNIIFQSIPNYSSNQFTGHQNNKSVAFIPPPKQESRTDNLVGDLVGRLITKIENDGNKQTQEYSKEIQPVNNTNSNSNSGNNSVVNIYNDGTKKEDSDNTNSKSSAIVENVRSAGEDFALQAGASAVGGIAAIAGTAIGTALLRNKIKIPKISLSRGNKLGGEAKIPPYKKPSPTAAELESLVKPNIPKTPTPTPSASKIKTPQPTILERVGNLVGLSTSKKKQGYTRFEDEITPANSTTPTRTLAFASAGKRTLAFASAGKRTPKINLNEYMESNYGDLLKPSPTRDIVPQVSTVSRPRAIKPPSRSSTPKSAFKLIQPARVSDVHETTRPGATTTRVFEYNQEVKEAIKKQPSRPSTVTQISEATTSQFQRPSTTVPKRGRPSGSKNKSKDGKKD